MISSNNSIKKNMDHKKTITDYEISINNTINYISQNLNKTLTLDELSKIANFSKFHFMRIFKAFTGETIGDFIRRLRLEKSAFYLIYNKDMYITEIALDCGYSSSQNYAKVFKNYFGISPSEYREKYVPLYMSKKSNPGNIIGNPGKVNKDQISYTHIIESKKTKEKLIQLD
jgi:AraC family transcriptional regulator